MVAAERPAGGVVDEWPLALRTGLYVATVPAEHDRGRAAPIDHEDRPLAIGRVERGERRREGRREQTPVAGRELGPQVDDRDLGRGAGRTIREAYPAIRPGAGSADRVDGRRGAAEHDGGTGQPAELDRHVARLEPRRPIALVGRFVLLVDDHQPDVGERGEDGQPGPDDDVDLAGPDPAPLVGPLARPDRRVEERHPRVEVCPEPVDERHRESDLGDEDEHRPAAPERGGDRLDVDRGLATARHAVEQERRGISSLERRADRGDGRRLRLGQRRGQGSSAPDAGRTSAERATWSLADVDRGQSTPDEAGQRRRPVAARQRSRAQPGLGPGHELVEQVTLAGTERPSRMSLAHVEGRDDRTSIVRSVRPALIAWSTGGREQGPVEVDQTTCGEVAQPSGEADPALRRRKVADCQRPCPELVEESPIGVVDRGRALVRGRGAIGPQLGDELEPFEDPRREHRPKHDRRWREIRLGDPSGEGEGQRREQRTVGADPIGDRLGLRGRVPRSAGPSTIPSACRRPNSTRTASPGSRSISRSGTE